RTVSRVVGLTVRFEFQRRPNLIAIERNGPLHVTNEDDCIVHSHWTPPPLGFPCSVLSARAGWRSRSTTRIKNSMSEFTQEEPRLGNQYDDDGLFAAHFRCERAGPLRSANS